MALILLVGNSFVVEAVDRSRDKFVDSFVVDAMSFVECIHSFVVNLVGTVGIVEWYLGGTLVERYKCPYIAEPERTINMHKINKSAVGCSKLEIGAMITKFQNMRRFCFRQM